MYRAKDLQRACPRSQAWLRQALANGLIGGAESQAATKTTTLKTSTRRFTAAARQQQQQQQQKSTVQKQSQSSKQLRPFSTSRTLQDDKDAEAKLDAESKAAADAEKSDIEVFVRDARAIFGNTLPKDYLSDDEYKLYLRLYGAPLRETQPEDVAILQAAERLRQAQAGTLNDELGDVPLIEEDDYKVNVNEKGQEYIDVHASARIYEEFENVDSSLYKSDGRENYKVEEYEVDIEAEEYRETDAEEVEEAEDAPNDNIDNAQASPADAADENTNYVQARARSERQYNMLTRLQKDFETARLKAEEAQKLQKEQDRQDEADLAMEAAAKAIEDEEGYVEEYDPENEHEEEDWEAEDDEFRNDPQDAAFFGNMVNRVHPLTRIGQSRTNPSTLQLPKANFIEPISHLLKRAHFHNIRMAAGQAFGGLDFPHSPRTVTSPTTKKRGGGTYQQMPVAIQASESSMRDIDADAYVAIALPYVYTTAMSTLTEVRRRLGPSWVENMINKADGSNPRVLDVGGGGGALAAWNTVFRAELSMLRDRGRLPKRGDPEQANSNYSDVAKTEDEAINAEEMKAHGFIVKRPTKEELSQRRRLERTVVVGSDELRHRASRFLNDTTFIPRLPDLLHSAENVSRHIDAPDTPHPEGRGRAKTYDVIIASHLLLSQEKTYQRHNIVKNLWAHLNPDGGVLIILEKGHPRGFEAVADARQLILDKHLEPPPQGNDKGNQLDTNPYFDGRKDREPGMIIAPCTSHGKCPMYLTPGLSQGRKDFCRFTQRFTRPPFLQRMLLGTHHNHENVDYSYIAVQRGTQKAELPEPAMPDAALTDKVANNLAKSYGISSDVELPPQQPLVQGKAAADAAFKGFSNVWTAPELPDADIANPAFRQPPIPAPPPPANAVNPHPLTLARTILPALKRQGHVTLDVCTPAGKLERWTVPRSFGKQAYHDARKARWGDLWALGAKTRVPKPVRLGKHLAQAAAAANNIESAKVDKRKSTDDVPALDDDEEWLQSPAVVGRTRNRQRAKWEKKTRGGKFNPKNQKGNGSGNKFDKFRGTKEQQAEQLMKTLKEAVYDEKNDP